MSSDISRYIVVDELFKRYTVYLGIQSQVTSVYCVDCDQWVFELDGDQLSTRTSLELFEFIVNQHDEQKHGVLVEIADVTDPIERFK